MKNKLFRILCIALIVMPLSVSADNIIKKLSTYSVQETMDKFEGLVKSKGMDVFARIDHAKNATSVDMALAPAQVIIFGNPKGGTVLMQQDISVSLDLPLRVAVFEDAAGQVWLSYHNPQQLKDVYAVSKGQKVLNKVEGALDKLTSAVTK